MPVPTLSFKSSSQGGSVGAPYDPSSFDPSKYQSKGVNPANAQLPSYLQGSGYLNSLNKAQAGLPGMFDKSGIQSSYDQMQQQRLGSAMASTGAAARATQNRAMLTGGRVGSGFAQASAMMPYHQLRSAEQFDLSKLFAGMQGQEASLNAQLAAQIAQSKLANRGLQSNFALGSAGMQQQNNQFNAAQGQQGFFQSAGLGQQGYFQNQQLSLQQQQAQREAAMQALQLLGGQSYSYNLNTGGQPMTPGDNAPYQAHQQQQAQMQALIAQLMQGAY